MIYDDSVFIQKSYRNNGINCPTRPASTNRDWGHMIGQIMKEKVFKYKEIANKLYINT